MRRIHEYGRKYEVCIDEIESEVSTGTTAPTVNTGLRFRISFD